LQSGRVQKRSPAGAFHIRPDRSDCFGGSPEGESKHEVEYPNTGSSKEFLCTLIIQENGTLASLKIGEHWRTCDLPIQQLKTSTELDLSDKGLGDEGTIIVSRIIK
jgi:hypothetical protein